MEVDGVSDESQWATVLERLRWKFANGLGLHVCCLGVEHSTGITEMILEQLIALAKGQAQFILADVKENKCIGEVLGRFEVYEFSKEIEADEIIITAPWRSRELEVVAKTFFQGRARVTDPFFPIRHNESGKLILNPYEEDYYPGRDTEVSWYSDFNRLNDINGIYRLAGVLHEYQPLFRHVEIETISRCNGTCAFCPVSAGNDIRDRIVMQDSLFYKIIDGLAELKFDGRVALFSNNEPLLDLKIIERQMYVHKQLPLAKMHLYTNGTLLTLEKFQSLIPYIDELVIDNYNQKLKLNPTSSNIVEYCKLYPELREKVTIMLRKKNEILTSRGGDAPNRKDKREFSQERCVLPFQQLIIRPDGKVSLCCNDPYGRMTLGDLNEQSLLDVWYGEPFRTIRDKMMDGRGNLPHCKYCDTFYYTLGC